jgi:hypothetical protein
MKYVELEIKKEYNLILVIFPQLSKERNLSKGGISVGGLERIRIKHLRGSS